MTAIEHILLRNYMHRDELLNYWNKRIQFLPLLRGKEIDRSLWPGRQAPSLRREYIERTKEIAYFTPDYYASESSTDTSFWYFLIHAGKKFVRGASLSLALKQPHLVWLSYSRPRRDQNGSERNRPLKITHFINARDVGIPNTTVHMNFFLHFIIQVFLLGLGSSRVYL